MDAQTRIIDRLKMDKILVKIINFIRNAMLNWSVESIVREQYQAEGKIQIDIFKGDSLSKLLFVRVVMQLNLIHRKCKGGYKLTKSQENINHLMCIYDIKAVAKIKKRAVRKNERIRVYNQDEGM